jgi:hypothetical protein
MEKKRFVDILEKAMTFLGGKSHGMQAASEF